MEFRAYFLVAVSFGAWFWAEDAFGSVEGLAVEISVKPIVTCSTYSLHCSSFLGLPFRILNIDLVKPKKGLQWRL